jgi:hypothetical protein
MDRLSEIAYLLPATPGSHGFLGELRSLLADVPYADAAPDRLTLTPPRPAGARPVTTFRLADVAVPEVAFDTGHSIGVSGGDAAEPRTLTARVAPAELTRRLAGHVRRVDHTGVNLPACATPPESWQALVHGLAATSTMYRYPTGEEWPFVLPSTQDEVLGDIGDFMVGREPRFELVHDQWVTQTLWQFALWTDLTRAELERLFPEPEGITPTGLEDVFRVVPVLSPWPELGIRFDLCFRPEEGPNPWETGEWLVTEGGRIR